IQSMNEGILVEDTSGRITFVNTSAAKMLGYGSEELIGKHWKTAISSDHLWLVEREAAKRSHGIASRYETVLSTRDGQSVPVIVSARPLFNEGQFAGVLAVFTDITELKKAEKALRESEARYRTISDLTSDFAYAFRVEPDGTLTREWTTEAFTHITGFSLEEIDRRGDWTRFVPSSDAATAQQPSELRIITKDGDTRWLSIRSRPVRNEEQGRIVRVVGAAQDITDRKQAEEAFIRRNRELTALNAIATILNQHLDPQKALNATVDRILEMVEASAGWIQLLDEETHTLRLIAYRGFSSQALTAIRSITLNTDASAIAHMGEDGILDQVARLTENVRLKDLDACTHIPIKAKERVLGILGIFSKQPCRIGPQKQQLLTAIAHQIGTAIENMQLAEEASEIEILRELSRLRSELVANVSHELRTPLGLIKFFVTSLLMEDANFDWDTRLKFLRGIDEEADRLEIIVDNLLDISRVESGRLRLDKRPTNVNQLVKEIVESMRIELELDPLFTRHHLAYDFPPTPLIASIDARRIEQVLRNLLSNAVKYSPEGGKITVQGHGNQNQIIIWVNDQGVGIPPQDLERVFERFYRVENEVTQQTRGAGLGLAVCRGIIEAHRGHIWADSVHGEGSVFYFTIPIDLSAP
ncbi:MAG TPA: PAS domain S-box protein, partial [Chloroflexi bacterium]|nr:PAS domain S-box protein [Chloroflexota bacterium]